MNTDQKVLLLILDGWGLGPDPSVSAIAQAETPFFDALSKNYATATLEASGLAVGLPDGQMGNSEVGHMNLGAGRVVYQDLVKINLAVEDGSLATQPVLAQALAAAQQPGTTLHLIGLLSDGGVHSHIAHLKGLLTAAHQAGLSQVQVHAFTDGRDTDPKGGAAYLAQLEKHMAQTTGRVASLVGRYYAMDRDQRWERVKLAYDLLVNGQGSPFPTAAEAIAHAYAQGETDEFVKPCVVVQPGQQPASIQPGDVVICFNFRTDRGRQITQALTQQAFPQQGMQPLPLHYVTLTNYDDTFQGVHVIYSKDNLDQTLGQVLAQHGKKQIRIAETEKYPHVTFFFSGGREQPFEGESRILIPSPKVATYDLQPEMSAQGIVDAVVPELQKAEADFICLNFANTDMVGHTGVMDAAIAAAEAVDHCLKQVVEAAQAQGYTCLVLADHGNSDVMRNPDGSPNTAHTTNPVPFIVVHPSCEVGSSHMPLPGVLGDVAPTILHLMGLPQPAEMSGKVLIASK